MSLIKVEELKYRYPNTKKLALNNVSFSIKKGEFIGIIGPNNAGKSTLCFALTGLVPHFFKGAYGGKVWIDGMLVKDQAISDFAGKVGLVFENPFSQMTGSKQTVYEEVAFGLENIGVERDIMVERIEESLRLLDIYDIRDKHPFQLSGGQMQRVAIASVIAMKPDILMLDEPTSQLDPQGSEEVFRVLDKLRAEGITIMMAEHKMEKIAQYSDKVILLHEGKLIDYDTPQNVFSRDDLDSYQMKAPIITQIAKKLDIRNQHTGQYPVTLDELPKEALVMNHDTN